MPRQPRLDLAGVPQHIVQRGNDRLPCFLDDADRRRYLQLLGEALLDTGCALHAHVLMDNHVHLPMTPAASGQVARAMRALGRRYARYINDRYRRTGILGQAVTKPAWSIAKPACCAATATSNSIRCARGGWRMPATTRGRASPATHRACRTR